MVEVIQLSKKKNLYYFGKNQTKKKTKQMQLKEGFATPSTPPLDPPLSPLGHSASEK